MSVNARGEEVDGVAAARPWPDAVIHHQYSPSKVSTHAQTAVFLANSSSRSGMTDTAAEVL
jgi:hypothetical protein